MIYGDFFFLWESLQKEINLKNVQEKESLD